MLHGNGETHEIFNRSISLLQEYFTVYAIDFRDHGNSSKVSELHYEDHAKDIYEFI
ncbi:alpha/beta fold hydrolase, partial [Vallitalea maricola]